MEININTETNSLTIIDSGRKKELPLYSDKAFELISDQWLKVGWNQKYPYCFSWMGRPVIQLPEDIVRTQEVIYKVKPTVVIETGVAHGGGLVLYASLLKAMEVENPRVIGVDIEIREHNRAAIEAHELFDIITLVEGSSVEPAVVEEAVSSITKDDRVLVILDSCHTKDHVAEELKMYHPYISKGSYIVATDGSMRDLHDVPRGDKTWVEDHPAAAAEGFVATHDDFVLEQPEWPFNESGLSKNITHWPSAYLRRVK